jgi:TrmH family RNA methyltransferase
LGRRSARYEESAFVVEGALLIEEAVSAGWRIEAEFVSPDHDPVTTGAWFHLAPGVLERVSSTQSAQGNLAVVTMPDSISNSVGSNSVGSNSAGSGLEGFDFLLVADRISDPGNLGTLLRSAEAAGVDAVVLTPDSVDVFNPKVVRSTAGALFHIPVRHLDLQAVRQAGFTLIGTSSHLGVPHTEMDWSGRIALVLGNEAHGVNDYGVHDPDGDSAPIMTEWVRIQHHGRAESLNVAMAGTVLCFEAARQRSTA